MTGIIGISKNSMSINRTRQSQDTQRRGSNMIEFCLFLPWYIFLFVGAYDFGFYNYSLIATENAAHAAALVAAQSTTNQTDSTTACSYALDSLRNLPNVGSGVTTCNGSPVTVTAASVTSPDGTGAAATQVTVTYKTPTLIPIPGILPSSLTITRSVQMRLQS